MFSHRDALFRYRPATQRTHVVAFVSGCAFIALIFLIIARDRHHGVEGWSMLTRGAPRVPLHAKLHYSASLKPASQIGELKQHWIFLVKDGVVDASFWHSPAQLAVDRDSITERIATFVCEIPAGTRAKMEINKAAKQNPIVQDTKAGELRAYPMPLGVTYGALSQTYEHPDPAIRDAFTGLAGDGDPIDALDISSASGDGDGEPGAVGEGQGARGWLPSLPRTGDVYPVRVIGALAMVDGGEADWKVITVRTDDPLLGGVTDVSQLLPGREETVVPRAEVTAALQSAAAGGGSSGESFLEAYTSAESARQRPLPVPTLSAETIRVGQARLRSLMLFFSSYKKANPGDPDEESPVSFAFDRRLVDAPVAMAVIIQGYSHWCALVQSAAAAAQRDFAKEVLGRARGHLVECHAALGRLRLREHAQEVPLTPGVWV